MKTIVIGEKFDKFIYRESCYGIVEKDGKLLLESKLDGSDLSLIGGGIEPGESLEQALKREFLEESGYTIKSATELVNIISFWKKADGRRRKTNAKIFIVEVDENTKKEPLEPGHKLTYVPIQMAREMIYYPYHKEAIKIYLENKKN